MKPGYKQTEIGVIPEDWSITSVEEIGHITSGESPTLLKEGPIPYFKVEQLNNSLKYQVTSPYHVSTNRAIAAGSIIFPKRGAAIATNKIRILAKESYIDTNIMALTVRTNTIFAEYLYYWLIRKGLWDIADTTSVPQINNKHIYPLQFPTPALPEQKRIAEALSDVDELISSLEKLIAKKKAIKQGAMEQLLTGKTRLPGFSGEWENVRLGTLGAIRKGSGISKEESSSGSIRAVRYGELYTKHQNYVVRYYSHISKEVSAKSLQVAYGDVLFAASGETKEEIGKCAAIIDAEPVYAGGDILVFRATRPLNPVFMGTLLNMPYVCAQRAEKGQGDAVVHIHANDLSDIAIAIPPFDEQKAIAEVLSDMDGNIHALEARLVKAQQIKQGMMQQLLTGKIRLV